MAVPLITVTLTGTSYPIPQVGSSLWGQAVTNFLIASAGPTGFMQMGGTNTLLSTLDLGANFGVKALFLASKTANPADAGVLRLANADFLAIRNFGNSANNQLLAGATANSQSRDDLYWKNATTSVTTQLTGNPYAEYTCSAAPTINASAATTVNFANLVVDTDTAVTTGAGWVFTVPANKGGQYEVSAAINAASGAGSPTRLIMSVYKNAGEAARLVDPGGTVAVVSNSTFAGATTITCAAGDTISIKLQLIGGTSITLAATAVLNRVTIKKLP